MSLLKTLLLLLLAVITAGQEDSSCPIIPPVSNFNNVLYAGKMGQNKWFWYKSGSRFEDRKCSHEYTYALDDGRIQFFPEHVRKSDGSTFRGSGIMYPVQKGVGHFNFSEIDDISSGKAPVMFTQDIIATDYDSYVMFYNCKTRIIHGERIRFLFFFIFTRFRITKEEMQSTRSQKLLVELEKKLSGFKKDYNLDLSLERLADVEQNGCPPAKEPCLKMVGGAYERCKE